MQPKRIVFGLILSAVLFALQSHAQSIEGSWVGNYGFNVFSSKPQKLVIELFLHNDSIVTGTSHLYHHGDNYEHYTILGVYHKADSTIYFKEDSTIGVKLGFGGENVLGNYTMQLSRTDTTMRFDGKWKENNSSVGLMNSKVWLEKRVPRNPPPKVKDKNLNRQVNIQSLIEIPEDEKDSIKLEVWDNSQIDGDVVSVYVGDSLIAHNEKLTATHWVYFMSVNKDKPIVTLTMAAESQGSVPPCTAHMLISTKTKKREIDLSSDSYKSGSIQFFLKE